MSIFKNDKTASSYENSPGIPSREVQCLGFSAGMHTMNINIYLVKSTRSSIVVYTIFIVLYDPTRAEKNRPKN